MHIYLLECYLGNSALRGILYIFNYGRDVRYTILQIADIASKVCSNLWLKKVSTPLVARHLNEALFFRELY